uniref:Uncharacterized protein n=1 Tax=Cucumis melo TaxID=3656 RepID=A0A9I9EJZ8_CUCME
MNELIFGSDKFVYLTREDLLHYCGMVEIGYMCILAYITGLKIWQAKHDLQRYRSTLKWRPVKCPHQLDYVGCGYYMQKYIHEILNTKSAYRQEEIDEIRTKWAGTGSPIVFGGVGGPVLDDCICCSTIWKCGKVDILEDIFSSFAIFNNFPF